MLASLYLEENLKTREQQTAGASRFLEEEAQGPAAELADLDAKIAVFKAKNINAVPELQQVNYQGLDRIRERPGPAQGPAQDPKREGRLPSDAAGKHADRKHRPGQEPPQGSEGQARAARKPLLRQVPRCDRRPGWT